jgi:hypothetical protein
LTKIILRVL